MRLLLVQIIRGGERMKLSNEDIEYINSFSSEEFQMLMEGIIVNYIKNEMNEKEEEN